MLEQKQWFMFVPTDCESHQSCEYVVEDGIPPSSPAPH